jgi:excisionase family DNA binding protein
MAKELTVREAGGRVIPAQSDLLTVTEFADLLRLKPSTIRAWTSQNRIPFVKVGRLVRIRRSDAEAYIASQVVPADVGSTATCPTDARNNVKADLGSPHPGGNQRVS